MASEIWVSVLPGVDCVWVKIQADTLVKEPVWFRHSIDGDRERAKLYASALAKVLDEALHARIEAVRKAEYEEGWSDKAKHRVKQAYFLSSLWLQE